MNQPAPLRSVILLLALAACGGDAATPQVDAAARRSTARALVGEFSKSLLGELTQAIAKDGTAAAVAVCSERAPAIAANTARDGYTLRRIGTRVRNHATNVPTAAERQLLDRFAAMPAEQRSQEFIEVEVDGRWTGYAPISIGVPLCLSCHGSDAQIQAEVRARLAELYPRDEAVGYALADLRGAVVIESAR